METDVKSAMKSYNALTAAALCCFALWLATPAQAQSPTSRYNRSQSSYEWSSKHNNFHFTGTAEKREGDYVTFKTDRGLEIILPIKYLCDKDLAYLKYLSGEGPLPAGISTPSTGNNSTSGMASNNPPGSGGDSTDNNTTPKPPEEGPTDRVYRPGEMVEVLVDGKWFPGKIFAARPADSNYFVSYSASGVPRNAWIGSKQIRPQTPDEPAEPKPMPSTEPMPGPMPGTEPMPTPMTDPVPDKPEESTPDKTYKPGDQVAVLVDGTWCKGQVLAARPGDGSYFISYTVGNSLKRGWLPSKELRERKAAAPATPSDATGTDE